jgi:hypothetical protein
MSRDYTPKSIGQEEMSRLIFWQHCRLVFVPQLHATPSMTDEFLGIAQFFCVNARILHPLDQC